MAGFSKVQVGLNLALLDLGVGVRWTPMFGTPDIQLDIECREVLLLNFKNFLLFLRRVVREKVTLTFRTGPSSLQTYTSTSEAFPQGLYQNYSLPLTAGQ